MLAYEEADRRLLGYSCPLCRKSTVDVNASDYYECRSCHRQFSRGARDESAARYYLFTGDEYLKVEVLPELGNGSFPAWDARERARSKIEEEDARREAEKKLKRRRRVSK